MLSAFIPFVRSLKVRFPALYGFLLRIGKKYFSNQLGVYPRPLSREIQAVTDVLQGSQWNMVYGKGLAHEKLESAFAEYIGTSHAIAVNTGGMALQMSMRALGLKPGNEVILQVDTCSATAFAVMNAGCTPTFSDVSEKTFMLSLEKTKEQINANTKALIATHMWGNAEDTASLHALAKEHGIRMIEDACLSLGTITAGKMAGASGDVGVFSFGCLKPIQAGEGGMIVTNDEALAKELRSLRHWGDRTIDFGVRDSTQLAWNGRMSEIVAAVVSEQLKGYPQYLSNLRDAVSDFQNFIQKIDGLTLVLGNSENVNECSFTQVVLQLDSAKLGIEKSSLMEGLKDRGIATWHANFELIPSLSFFQKNTWKDWILKGDLDRINANYHGVFPHSKKIFDSSGIGINKINFHSAAQVRHLKRQIEELIVASK